MPSTAPRTETSAPRCPACDATPRPALVAWLAHCPTCGLWSATAPPAPSGAAPAPSLDEASRSTALEPLRQANFKTLLDLLETIRPLRGTRLLDVGCAHGWFVELARARGVEATGIEPDAPVAAQAAARGLPIRVGFFPDAVRPGERWDVIVFNDVFEHLPEPVAVLDACARLLTPGGLLVLNVPDSRGIFYRVARVMARAGATGPLARLWQRDFPSPHLFYFDASNLQRLIGGRGFALRRQARLATMHLRGLWERLVMDPTASRATAAVTWAGLVAAYPLLVWLLPSDILVQVYAREERTS